MTRQRFKFSFACRPPLTTSGLLGAATLAALAALASVLATTAGAQSFDQWDFDRPRNVMLGQGLGGLAESAEPGDSFGQVLAVGDFNGDRLDDLAVGVPRESTTAVLNGVVQVIYGKKSTVFDNSLQYVNDLFDVNSDQVFSQALPALGEAAEDNDRFGEALTVGDFNGDGFDDLAIGVPFDALAVGSTGVVHVIYGSTSGLNTLTNQLLSESALEGPGLLRSVFGAALCAGDFDHNGVSDLAIGAINAASGDVSVAGAVYVLYGAAGQGLDLATYQRFTRDDPGIPGAAAQGDLFGWGLAAGDFDGDSTSDLAIGAPLAAVGGVEEAGSLTILYGQAGEGLVTTGSQLWDQASPGVDDDPETYDEFGRVLATGDLNGDGFDDLAVGMPSETFSFFRGAIHFLFGSEQGLATTGNFVFGWGESGHYGAALAIADFDGDGKDDLLAGAPDWRGDGIGGARLVLGPPPADFDSDVLFWEGMEDGVTGSFWWWWGESDPEVGDRFGEAVAIGDFNGSGTLDVVIGIPGEEPGLDPNLGEGRVLVVSGCVWIFSDGFEDGDLGAWDPSNQTVEDYCTTNYFDVELRTAMAPAAH